MAFDKSVGIGNSPFLSGASIRPGQSLPPRSLSPGLIPAARPPRLWAPLQVPQKDSHEVNLLNKTAPITSPTRPYTTDASGFDGTPLSGSGVMDALNGGG